MTIVYVFDQLMSRRLKLHHSIRIRTTDLNLMMHSFIVGSDMIKVVSSANILIIIVIIKYAISFMKIKKNSGPRIELYGTPSCILVLSEEAPQSFVVSTRSVK